MILAILINAPHTATTFLFVQIMVEKVVLTEVMRARVKTILMRTRRLMVEMGLLKVWVAMKMKVWVVMKTVERGLVMLMVLTK